MFHRRILFAVLLVVIVIGLMGMAGGAGYRAGFSQAYMAQWLAQSGNRAPLPFPPMFGGYGGYGLGHFGFGPFFPGLGSLLLIGLLILLALGAFRALAFHRWADQVAGGQPAGHMPWGRHGFRPGGPWGWCCGEEPRRPDAPKQPDAPADQGKPSAGSGETQTTG
jgi:hypothetical protein